MKLGNTLLVAVIAFFASAQAHAFGALPFKLPGYGPAPAPAPSPAPPPKACSFNGKSIASGSSVIAYQNAQVPYGQACVSQSRSCSNGVLSGSYANSACAVSSAPPPPVAVVPKIGTQPSPQTVSVGQTATFSVVATGTAPLSYQWKKNGANISGANSASYVTPAVQSSDNGAVFTVLVSDSAGNVLSAGAALTVNSTGKTYYVSTAGSDSNAGSQAAPFRTIVYAYSQAAAGDTILVAPGTYTDYNAGWGLHLGNSGTASAPITLRSTVLHGAVLDGSGTNFSQRIYGFVITGNYNIVDGFKIVNMPGTGVRVENTYNQLLRNEIAGNGLDPNSGTNGSGIFEATSGLGNIFEQNNIHDNGKDGYDHGLYLCGDNGLIENNLIIHNSGAGIQIAGYSGVDNMKIYNNTISLNGTRGIVFWAAQEDGGTTINNAQVYNNIISSNGTDGIDGCGPAGTGNLVSNNIIFGNAGTSIDWNACGAYGAGGFQVTVSNTVAQDPLFVNAAGSNFQLKAGSPGYGAGLNLPQVTVDFSGNPRAAPWTIGAYQ
jgi:Right handed beta helix region/Immunoglobulin I-set domain